MRVLSLLILIAVLFSAASAEDFKIGQSCVSSITDEYAPGEIVVKFKDGVSKQQAAIAQSALGTTVISTNEKLGFHQLAIPSGKTVEQMVEAFSKLPDVEYAEPNYLAHAFMTPNDPYYSYQWHFPLINMPAAWDQSTGSGVTVAVIDCGVAYETYGAYTKAPDLAGTTFVPGYDFINGDSHPNDDCAHGTHVCGTIAQTTNNSLGVAGIAYNCSIMPVKVLDSDGYGTYTAIANGITFAADNGAKVLNLSLGGASSSSTLQNAVIYAYNLGCTIVCAAGNAGTSAPQYPAAYTQSISVSAVRYDKTYTWYTSHGSAVDICAPGGDLNVDQNGDGYVDGVLQQTHDGTNYGSFGYYFYEGTSMACPHVAGLAALLIAKNGGTMTPAEVRAALQNTAEDLGSAGWDQYYGYGLIDADAALQSISTSNPPVAAFSGTPTSGFAPLTVNFTDASTNNPTSWSWTFGDGGTSTAQNPSHVYTAAGTYTVTLTATNAYGSDSETKTGYITVTTCVAPVAAFVGSPTSGTAPLTVGFTDQSTNSPTSWSWSFGDGGTSTSQNPSHQYTAAGTYTVTLSVSNSCGSDDEVKASYITVTAPTQSCDDFADGSISNWGNSLGTWTATGGYMKGNSTTLNARRTSPFGSFSTATITCDVRMNTGQTQRKARIIFGYTDGNNYRYVEGDDVSNAWRICERISGSNYTRRSISRSISSATWYSVTVTAASDGNVLVAVGGVSIGSYKFSAVKSGLVGCGYNRSNSDFDNFCVGSSVSMAFSDGELLTQGNEEELQKDATLPSTFSVDQNFPNPFNPSTTINFYLPSASQVKVEVFNIMGQLVKMLADESLSEGPHSVEWNATNDAGEKVASGIYFYRVTAGDMTQTKKMLLMK
jgi:serine protease